MTSDLVSFLLAKMKPNRNPFRVLAELSQLKASFALNLSLKKLSEKEFETNKLSL